MIGNEGSNKGCFIAETEAEESLMLMGKLNALEGVLRWNPELVNAEMVNALFGFGEIENAELKKAKESEDYWYHRFCTERDRADALAKELEAPTEEEKEEETNGNTV